MHDRIPIHLFFALLPPQEMRPRIARLGWMLRKANGLGGQIIAPDRLHTTLASVHDSRASLTELVMRAKTVAADIHHPPFLVRFEWSESFRLHRNRHPLVLRGDLGCLIGFRQEMAAQMARYGFAVSRGYTPHVTLLWADRCVEANPIAPIAWTVKEFALVASLVGKSCHIHLARWQLQRDRRE